MRQSKVRSLFTKKRLFTLIIPVGIVVIVVSVFSFTNYSKGDSELTNKLAGKILLQIEN